MDIIAIKSNILENNEITKIIYAACSSHRLEVSVCGNQPVHELLHKHCPVHFTPFANTAF